MNTEDLHAFLSVAEQRSFSLAAESLHLTQPAISKRIAALEKHLDARLFDRIGRQVSLTEAGRTLQVHARRIMAEIEDSQRSLRNLSGEVRGSLKMASSHHISLHRLPPVLQEYTQHYPEVQLDLCFMDSELASRAVEQGELELALVTLPPAGQSPLTIIEVWCDTLVPVASPTHPLSLEANITTAALTRYPAILPARGTYTRDLIDQQLEGTILTTLLETHYLETIKMMVSVGLGWSLLPDTMVDKELCPQQAQHIQVVRKLGIVHHPQRTLSNAASAFIKLITEMA